jgi:hypothetical protein
MLGTYEGFPNNVQTVAFFVSSVSHKRLQQVLTAAFHRLNLENLALEDIGNPSIPNCKVVFELGIANSQTFIFLDDKEKAHILRIVNERPFLTMDFLCAIRYYRTHEGQIRPLRFDYYLLRLLFGKKLIELRIFHERGSMHVAPGELAAFLGDRVNRLFPKKVLKVVEAP